jgi:DNA helicase HerA-like ATPase
MNERFSIYDEVQSESIFRVGKVISVEGRAVRVEVDKGKNHSNLIFKGTSLQNISVGGYVKISKGFIDIIGKVEGESIKENKESNGSYKTSDSIFHRILNVSLLGFIDGRKFERGIKELPLIDNQCFLLSKEEFKNIHKFYDHIKDKPINLGTLSLEKGQSIELGVNTIFASHIGIFGNTGSGKSYTLTKIYNELFKQFCHNQKFVKNSQFVFIDFNGEYISNDAIIDEKYKNVYDLSTSTPEGKNKLPLHKSSLHDSAFWSIFLEATEKTQSPFLARALNDKYILDHIDSDEGLRKIMLEIIHAATTQNDRLIEKSVVTDFLAETARYLGQAVKKLWELNAYFRDNLRFHSQAVTFILENKYANNSPEAFGKLIEGKIAEITYHPETVSDLKKSGCAYS